MDSSGDGGDTATIKSSQQSPPRTFTNVENTSLDAVNHEVATISIDNADDLLPLQTLDDMDTREHVISSGSEVSTVSELNTEAFEGKFKENLTKTNKIPLEVLIIKLMEKKTRFLNIFIMKKKKKHTSGDLGE